MSWRLYSVLAGLTVVTLFSGCASQPRTNAVDMGEQAENITGPSTTIAGARVDEVRSLALGSATSRGWTIVSASDQKIVLRRPVSPDAPQAVELGLADNGTPPRVEVTSLFRQAPGGVQVTVNAQLVARVQGQGKGAGQPVEQRIDYTESYRDNLQRSLESLRSNWAAHHQRVARALPPIAAAGQAASETAAELNRDDTAAGSGVAAPMPSPLSQQPTPTAWGESPQDEPEPVLQAVPARVTAVPVGGSAAQAAQPAPRPPAPASAQGRTAAQPKSQAAPPAKVQPATPTKKAQAAASAQPKTPPATKPAAKPAGSIPTPVRTASPQTRPPAAAVSVSSADNMLTLNRGPKAGSQVSNAERYAAQRGCKVRSGRTDTFKRDGASEYLRVFCTGDPAFVVKCTNGACRALE